MSEPGFLDALTPREREVCELIAEGLTVRQTGERLEISPRTVENHVYAAARLIPGPGTPIRRIVRAFAPQGSLWQEEPEPDRYRDPGDGG